MKTLLVQQLLFHLCPFSFFNIQCITRSQSSPTGPCLKCIRYGTRMKLMNKLGHLLKTSPKFTGCQKSAVVMQRSMPIAAVSQ